MPTGISTYLNGITISGTTYYGYVDLESVFHARGTSAARAATALSGAGRDLADWFYSRALGGTTLEADTGIRSAGTDVRQLFAKRGSVSSGGGGGGGCLPFETPVPLWDAGTKQMGDLRPGDILIGYYADGMIDASAPHWHDWTMPEHAAQDGVLIPVTVVTVMLAAYDRYYLINGGLRATDEHPFLALRDSEWSWRNADKLRVGDALLTEQMQPLPIHSIELVNAEIKTANLNVEEVDNYFASTLGTLVLTHNSDIKG